MPVRNYRNKKYTATDSEPPLPETLEKFASLDPCHSPRTKTTPRGRLRKRSYRLGIQNALQDSLQGPKICALDQKVLWEFQERTLSCPVWRALAGSSPSAWANARTAFRCDEA